MLLYLLTSLLPLRLDAVRRVASQVGRSTAYDGHCRNLSSDAISQLTARNTPYVIRLKVPKPEGPADFLQCSNYTTTINDINYGTVSFENRHIDDQVSDKPTCKGT